MCSSDLTQLEISVSLTNMVCLIFNGFLFLTHCFTKSGRIRLDLFRLHLKYSQTHVGLKTRDHVRKLKPSMNILLLPKDYVDDGGEKEEDGGDKGANSKYCKPPGQYFLLWRSNSKSSSVHQSETSAHLESSWKLTRGAYLGSSTVGKQIRAT